MVGRTETFVIAHRLSTINADLILVMVVISLNIESYELMAQRGVVQMQTTSFQVVRQKQDWMKSRSCQMNKSSKNFP